ncbi:MAG: hypothetical protein LBR31_00025 [Desulfovibrio sp.]|nr:hypothetical protein [Desulfovibrio sp.]
MNDTAAYYHKRFLVADCASGRCAGEEISEEFLLESLTAPGGLAVALSRKYPESAVFGAGPLTGSFAPASGGLTLAFDGGRNVAFIPLGHGAALRQCGFDALALIGMASGTAMLRCRPAAATVENIPAFSDRRELRRRLLLTTENGLASLILADAPQGRDAIAAAGLENGPSPQGRLAYRALRQHGLLALSLEGEGLLPPIPVPLNNVAREAVGRPSPAWENEIAPTGTAGAMPKNVVWKSAACLHCPSPCLAWLQSGAFWILHADHKGFAAALARHRENTPTFLEFCDRRGLDATVCAGLGPPESILESPDATDFEIPEPAGLDLADDAVAAGLTLGLCPKLLRRFPALSSATLGGLLSGAMNEAFLVGRRSEP